MRQHGEAIEVVPSGRACGAEVRGVDLSRPLDQAGFATVLDALVGHGVLVFRGQSLTEAQQIAFTRRFGEPDRYSLGAYCLPDHPEILLVSNVQVDGRNIGLADAGTTWHTDSSYLAVPPFATLLHAKEIPMRDGAALGDTLFSSAAAAYEALPAATRARIDGLVAVHSYAAKHQARARLGRSDRKPPSPEEQEGLAPVRHPVVRRHPISGRTALYVAEGECSAIESMANDEARELIAELAAQIVKPDFHYRHCWQVGDLVVWDNCQLQHLAIKDYALPERRLLHRTQVKGTVPV
jgi:taurine dioxygenase